MTDLRSKIAEEIYKAMEQLEAPVDLLAVIGSYGDTLDDEEILAFLKDWNTTGIILRTGNN